MKNKINYLLLSLLMANPMGLIAQEAGPEMADTFRAEGKIYVVVGVLLIIFAGIATYLIRLDRKISKLEKVNNK
jgi:uncharacterized transporter YbjL